MTGGENKPKAPWWQPGLLLFIKMSSWIAAPVVLATILGKYLDRKFQTEPWLFLVTVGISFIISMAMLVRYALKEMKKIDSETKNNKEK